MGPPSNTTAAISRRQSCDRCHDQKLRCSRKDTSRTGACDRCLRKGTLCSYSSCLPKGRPSLYRLNERGLGSKEPEQDLNTSSASPATRPTTPIDGGIEPDHPDPSTAPARPDKKNGEPTPVGSHAPSLDVENDVDVDMGVDINGSTKIAVDDSFLFECSVDEFADHESLWRWHDEFFVNNMLDISPDSDIMWHPAKDTQVHTIPELSSSIFKTSNMDSSTEGGPAGQIPPRAKTGPALETMGDEKEIMSRNNNGREGVFELGVAQLSQLCIHLSQLLPQQPRDHDPARAAQSPIHTVFNSVNSWLAQGSSATNPCLDPGDVRETKTTGDLLHHVFSASIRLLEILNYLQPSLTISTPSLTKPSALPTTFASLHGGIAVEPPIPSTEHSSPVIHHLVLACVTLLLKVYVAVLVALQRNADALNSSLLSRIPVEPGHGMNESSRGHIQLVSVVQLCSYFIKRQNQTLDMKLSQGSLFTPSSQKNDHQQRSPSPNTTCKQAVDAMSDLKTEVEQRLKRLQESLCIIT